MKAEKLRLESLSPVHIGSNEELSPMEYYFYKEKGEFGPLKIESLFEFPQVASKLNELIKKAEEGRRYIGDFISPSILKKHTQYVIQIKGEAQTINPTNVKTFIKSSGNVFVPGSSVKGSILSAMFYEVLKKKDNRELKDMLSNAKRYDELLGYVFDNFSKKELPIKNKKFSSWLRVSDSDLKCPENVLELRTARVVGSRRGGQLPVLYETLKPGAKFDLEIECLNVRYTLQEILEITDSFYRKVWEKDDPETSPPPDKYLIRLGQGSTNYSTSLLILAEEKGIYIPAKKPVTRKRIDGKEMMGWCLLGRVIK